MSDTDTPGRFRLDDVLVAGLVAVAVLTVAFLGVERAQQAEERKRAEEAEASAGGLAAAIGVDLERGLRGLGSAAARAGSGSTTALAGQASALAPGATELGFLSAAGEPAGQGSPVLDERERAAPQVAAALDRARDSGEPQLTALDDDAAMAIVAPVYTGAVPDTPAARRDSFAAWAVARIDLDALVAEHRAGDLAVIARDAAGDSDLDPPASSAAAHVVEVGDRAVEVIVEERDGGGLTGSALALAVLGLAAATLGAVLVLAARVRGREEHEAAVARASQVRLIGEVAPIVQQSLELSEVLPSVAVQLSDHFGLAGITLSQGASRAGQTQLFSIGADPDAGAKAVLQPPASLAAGETLVLALQRGGRSVALLQVVAGRDLDASELESLRALSELVTAALVNATLYASQQDALARLRELDGLKTVFLGTASHELRTPATAIAGFAGLLTTSWDRFTDEQRRDFVERIGANARSLSAVVQDLLDFSLLDRGTLAVALEPLDLGAVVSGVIDRLGPAVAHEHDIESSIEPTPAVAGDLNGLERITTNLLTNAVKFSPAGSTIRVSVRSDGDDVLLVVADQGPGVPTDERERVFTRFYRGTGDAVTQTRGVGIGLSVVSEFVSRMHGEVSVDDAPGGGARFTVRLPTAAVASTVEP
jgi:signal transduction histidine kinase